MTNLFDIDKYARDTYKAVNAIFDYPDAGIAQVVDTLTSIMDTVIDAKYYTVPFGLSDYIKIDAGRGAYAQQIFQYQSADISAPFKSCIINPASTGIHNDATADVQLNGFTVANNFYRQKYSASKEELKMAAANLVNFDLLQLKEQARLKNWQLGFQGVIFEGLGDGKTFGLLNQPNVTINTTLLPAPIHSLTTAQLKTFASSLLATYLAVNNATIMPNRLLMPTSDAVALGVPASADFPIGTIYQYIENAFKQAGAPADFKIVHSTYGEEAGATGGGRYVLYNTDADNLIIHNPLPYTPYPLYPVNALDMISDAEAQFTGVRLGRAESMLYIDAPAPNAG